MSQGAYTKHEYKLHEKRKLQKLADSESSRVFIHQSYVKPSTESESIQCFPQWRNIILSTFGTKRNLHYEILRTIYLLLGKNAHKSLMEQMILTQKIHFIAMLSQKCAFVDEIAHQIMIGCKFP